MHSLDSRNDVAFFPSSMRAEAKLLPGRPQPQCQQHFTPIEEPNLPRTRRFSDAAFPLHTSFGRKTGKKQGKRPALRLMIQFVSSFRMAPPPKTAPRQKNKLSHKCNVGHGRNGRPRVFAQLRERLSPPS